MSQDNFRESYRRLAGDQYYDLMLKAFEGESERSIGIVSICILDEQLEKLFCSYFIKDLRVSSLFKDEHILQTFHAKTSLAYFSGLIPRWLYEDLRRLARSEIDLHMRPPAICGSATQLY